MKFSIIIPTLNEAQGIVSCLTALQAWRGEHCEIIVVDGGSSDGTQELARPWADQTLASSKGRATQMNAGAAVAQGEILVFLHADTYLPEQALVLIAQTVSDERPWGRFDVRLSGKPWLLKIIAFMMNLRSRLTGIATGDQVIFVNRDTFTAVGRYPAIALMEDIALSKTLNAISRPICLAAKAISSGRKWERQGLVKTILLMWWLRLRYFLGADPTILADIYYRGEKWTR